MHRDPRLLARLQAVAAVGLPWLVAHVVAPGAGAWVWAGLAVPIAFGLRYARYPWTWLATLSGLASVLAFVPGWASALLALGVGGFLVVRPPTTVAEPATGPHRTLRTRTLAALLVGATVVILTVALLQVRQQDAAFRADQQAAEASWLTLTGEESSTKPLDPPATGAATLVGEPQEVQAEAAIPAQPPFARLRFAPRDDGTRPVVSTALYVGPDVTERGLAAGPGHYPSTARPGENGNIAIAGHRTGWGSPFLHLDELVPGDRIRLTDRQGVRHTYVVDSSIVVSPQDSWVLGPDPLGTGEPTLTLTTCDPPGINTERLIVFATLKRSATPETGDTAPASTE